MLVDLVNPWHRGSHRRWAEGYAAASGHAVRLVALEGAAWRWRLQAGAIPVAEALTDAWRAEGPPDVLLVSGMVDTAVLLGLLRPPPSTRVVVYQHESQVARPRPDQPEARDAVLAQWRGWLAADEIWFATEWHRAEALRGLVRFAEAQPGQEITRTIRMMAERTTIVPVGVELEAFTPAVGDDGPPVVLWSHRWEPDKEPEVFAAAVDRLADDGVPFRLALAGAFGDAGGSPVFDHLLDRHGERIVASAPLDRDAYVAAVRSADVVVSTAAHEFFGVSVVEALAAGSVPVVPDRLSYPELLGEHAGLVYPDRGFGSALRAAVTDLAVARERSAGLAASMRRFDWAVVAPEMDRRLAALST